MQVYVSPGSPKHQIYAIAHQLADAVIATTNFTKGFWHEVLNEEFSYLTTFSTEWEISIHCT